MSDTEDEGTEPKGEPIKLRVLSDRTVHRRIVEFEGAPTEPCKGLHAGKTYRPAILSLQWREDEHGTRITRVELTGPRMRKKGDEGARDHTQAYTIEKDDEKDLRPVLPGWATELLGDWADTVLRHG